jgi:hypothetical protein
MCENWGYRRLGEYVRHESIDEMKHADQIIDRILFLEGVPNMQRLNPVRVGETVYADGAARRDDTLSIVGQYVTRSWCAWRCACESGVAGVCETSGTCARVGAMRRSPMAFAAWARRWRVHGRPTARTPTSCQTRLFMSDAAKDSVTAFVSGA